MDPDLALPDLAKLKGQLRTSKDELLSSIWNARLAVFRLTKTGLLNPEQTKDILRRPMEQQRKEALFKALVDIPVRNFPTVTAELRKSGNDYVAEMLDSIVYDSFPEVEPVYNVPRAENVPRHYTRELILLGSYKARFIVKTALIGSLPAYLEWVLTLKATVDINEKTGESSLHTCIRRKNNISESIRILIEKFNKMCATNSSSCTTMNTETNPDYPVTLHEFLNHRNKHGNTALHLAVHFSLVEETVLLYQEYGCDIFIENNKRVTPLEMMYGRMPKMVNIILDGAITLQTMKSRERTLEMSIDFSAVIGKSRYIGTEPGTALEAAAYETGFLNRVIINNKNEDGGLNSCLSHFVIKLFVELKWEKILNSYWIYPFSLLQILWKLVYTLLIVHVFLVKCRYSEEQGNVELLLDPILLAANHTNRGSNPTSVWEYIFGIQANKFGTSTVSPEACEITSEWKIAASLVLVVVLLLTVPASCEFILNMKWLCRKSSKKIYLLKRVQEFFQLKHLLQLSNKICTAFICSSVMLSCVKSEVHYFIASVSLLLMYALLLTDLGSLTAFAVYIQILGKATKHLAMLMLAYGGLILAFAISLGITFPQAKQFKTLPESVTKVLLMMCAEFDYDSILYEDEPGSNSSTKLSFMAHIMFAAFAIVMTFILANLLIGLVIHDLKELKEKADLVLITMKLEQCQAMENTLWQLSRICRTFRRLSSGRKSGETLVRSVESGNSLLGANSTKSLPNIYVVPVDKHGDSMVVHKNVSQLPKSVKIQLREFIQRSREKNTKM